MGEKDMFRMDRFGCRPSEEGPLAAGRSKAGAKRGTLRPAEGTVQRLKVRQAGGRAGRMVACLVGSLLVILTMAVAPAASSARVDIGVSVNFGPPALPYYAQPACPGPGYIWTPGYWAWDPGSGYYWVPGTWVAAPFVGAMWTPGYWGYRHGLYVWFGGYWGPVVGFYGGINYGFGYTGYGYYGGYWDHDRFFYNREVNNIHNTYITNVYDRRVVENDRFRRASYNGGPGGVYARPTRAQFEAGRQRRFGPVNQQVRQERFARTDPGQRASFNHGRPDVAATPRAGEFRGREIQRATRAGAPYREPSHSAMGGRRAMNSSPAQASNRRGFERGPSGNAPRYSAPNAHMERRAPARENAGRQARAYNQQRSPNQARSAGPGRPQGHAAPERRGPAPQQERGNGGNGHGNGHGRGGRR